MKDRLTNTLSNGVEFPISRDPPEGGTAKTRIQKAKARGLFPISRDPPEGGTQRVFKCESCGFGVSNF